MNYFSVVLFFSLPMYISDSFLAYIAYLLAGRKMPYRKVFVLQIPAAFIQSMAYAAFILFDNSANLLILWLGEAVFSVADIVIPLSWVFFLFRDTEKKKKFFFLSAVFPFYVLAAYSTNALLFIMSSWLPLGLTFSDLAMFSYKIFMYFASFFLVHMCVVVIIRLVSKTNFWNKLQAFENYPKLYIPMGMLYFLFYIVARTISAAVAEIPWLLSLIIFPYFVLLVVVVLIVSDLKKTENLNAAQNLLLQQQNYINKLESIQQEIMSIQHDYKNILTGLYAHASEGNADAVKEYIDAKILKVDETVRENLSQMNQLTRIELPELKGLILTKMLEAERDKVSFRLEAMFPVNLAIMATEDLLRCVGILLDNAIEEARKQKRTTVTLLLLQEDKTLTVVVKNPVQDKPDLTRIQNEGYSTKGPGRGIGLANYQNIIQKYPNTTQETKIVGEYFVQVLVLAGS